jgi:hypothetical protein
MHPRAAFRISFAAGLLVLAVTLFSVTQEPVRPCGNLPQNYAPIIAFELARSPADLEALFGTQEPCRSEVVERMDAVNLVDVLVYIPAYGVFMAFFFLGMRGHHATLGTLGFRIAIVAILGDYAENACLMNLTPQLDPASVWFTLLPWATGIKWLGLGAAAAIAAAIYVKASSARFWYRGIREYSGCDGSARDVWTSRRPGRRAELAGVSDYGGRSGTAPSRVS